MIEKAFLLEDYISPAEVLISPMECYAIALNTSEMNIAKADYNPVIGVHVRMSDGQHLPISF